MDSPFASPHQPSVPCQTSPYLQRARNSRQFLEQNGKLVEQVLAVLDFMHSTDVTLSTLLWAVSWGVEELNSNHMVIFEHTSLLVSDKLLEILNNWFKPPQRHSAGIRTEAGQHPLAQWAFKTVSSSIEHEMIALKKILQLPPSDLMTDLAKVELNELVTKVSTAVPVYWKLLEHSMKPSPFNDDQNSTAVYFLSFATYKFLTNFAVS